MNRNYLYIFGCIAFTVYGQIILKWRIAQKGQLPQELTEKMLFLAKALIDPYIISGFIAAFIASLFWMAAMTKCELSAAYPFMSLAFALVLLFSAILFREPVTIGKVLGMALICVGLIVTAKL
jgi:multidrug transporter EmrE-like cation transporter